MVGSTDSERAAYGKMLVAALTSKAPPVFGRTVTAKWDETSGQLSYTSSRITKYN
jgi:hypothetical protein